MLKALPISAKQVKLLMAAQSAVEKAQRDLEVVIGALMAGHDIEGQVVSVDSEKNCLNVDVAEPSPGSSDTPKKTLELEA